MSSFTEFISGLVFNFFAELVSSVPGVISPTSKKNDMNERK